MVRLIIEVTAVVSQTGLLTCNVGDQSEGEK